MNESIMIGKNISKARKEAGMTQRQVGEAASISTTQLSAYENGKQMPGLVSLAQIASALGTTIDNLYYGDKDVSFITKSSSSGHAIVNSLTKLFSEGVITQVDKFKSDEYKDTDSIYCLVLNSHEKEIERLLTSLGSFIDNVDTFKEPKKFLDQILDSVANEINNSDTN